MQDKFRALGLKRTGRTVVRILANGFCGRLVKERKVVAISVASEEAIFVFTAARVLELNCKYFACLMF